MPTVRTDFAEIFGSYESITVDQNDFPENCGGHESTTTDRTIFAAMKTEILNGLPIFSSREMHIENKIGLSLANGSIPGTSGIVRRNQQRTKSVPGVSWSDVNLIIRGTVLLSAEGFGANISILIALN